MIDVVFKVNRNIEEIVIRKVGIIRTSVIAISWLLISIMMYSMPFLSEILKISTYSQILYIIGGFIIIPSSFIVRPLLEKRSIAAYEQSLLGLVDTEKKGEYIEDTEKWLNAIYHTSDKVYRVLQKIFLVFGIILVFLFSFFIGMEFYDYFYLIPGVSGFFSGTQSFNGNPFYLLISIILTITSFMVLLYFTLKVLMLCFGTSNIMHHFTFWTLKPLEKDEQDKIGELIVLNIIVFLIVLTCVIHYSIGYVLSASIFIISPINPSIDYTKHLSHKYKSIKKIIPTILGIMIVIRIGYYGKLNTDPNMIHLILQIFLIILWYFTWRGFITSKSVGNDGFSFDLISPLNKMINRLGSRIKIRYKDFIIILALLPFIGYIINFILFYAEKGYLFSHHYVILVSTMLFSLSFLTVYLGIDLIKDKTKIIAEIYYPHTWEDKKNESQYHFWETFGSPQMSQFSYPFGCIFLIYCLSTFSDTSIDFPWLEFSMYLILPYILFYFYLGFGFGMMIWTFYHGAHFSWHLMSLTSLNKEDLENTDILNPEFLKKQFSSIILTTFGGLLLFGIGYYMWLDLGAMTYITNFSLIGLFFANMAYWYNKIITNKLIGMREEILKRDS